MELVLLIMNFEAKIVSHLNLFLVLQIMTSYDTLLHKHPRSEHYLIVKESFIWLKMQGKDRIFENCKLKKA